MSKFWNYNYHSKTSFDWREIHLDRCPDLRCQGGDMILSENKFQRVCKTCGYHMNAWKYDELKKKINSKFYKGKIAKIRGNKLSVETIKARLLLARQVQEKEREWNREKQNQKRRSDNNV